MKNFDFVQSNCNKLMALAVLTKDLFGEQSLTDRVVIDIKDVIEKNHQKKNRKFRNLLNSRCTQRRSFENC